MTLANYIKTGKANKHNVQNKVRNLQQKIHSYGISHGDFKPANIMVELNSAGGIKKLWIVDLGAWRSIPVGHVEKNIRPTTNARKYNGISAFGNPITLKAFGNWKPNEYMLKRVFKEKPAKPVTNRFQQFGSRLNYNSWTKLKSKLGRTPTNKNITNHLKNNEQVIRHAVNFYKSLNAKVNNDKLNYRYWVAFNTHRSNNKTYNATKYAARHPPPKK